MADGKLVYSSGPEGHGPAPEPLREAGPAGIPPLGQVIKVRREKQGRGGKTVTALFEFQASDRQRETLAKELRKFLGTGGTVKDNVIELQGDQLAKVLDKLTKLGYKPRQGGG
jgi:translation initiation factor 1